MIALPPQLWWNIATTWLSSKPLPTSKETAVGLRSIWIDCPSVVLPGACWRTAHAELSFAFLLVKSFHFFFPLFWVLWSLYWLSHSCPRTLSHFFPQDEKQSLLCTAFFSFIQQSLLRLSSSFWAGGSSLILASAPTVMATELVPSLSL